MSFQDSNDLEAQPWGRYTDEPDAFQSKIEDLDGDMVSASSKISRLEDQIKKLGTGAENKKTRERVQSLVDDISTDFKSIGDKVKEVNAFSDADRSQRDKQAGVNKEFKRILTRYQGLQKTASEKLKASATAARAALDEQSATSPTGERSGFGQQLQEQEQMRLADQNEVDFQESLIVERESEIRNIEQSVGELNELFRDVAHMVHEQGSQLEIISENVENTRDSTQGAHKNLVQASRYQKNARSKACCLLLILGVVLTIVILAVVID